MTDKNDKADADKTATLSTTSDDDLILLNMGYKKDLFRGLNSFMNFSFGYTEVAVLISLVAEFSYGLSTGGPSALVWTWVTAFAMTMIVAHCLAEICGAFPSAGSVYHWAGQLAPSKWAPLSSYICGWTNFLGNFAGDAAFAYAWASFLNAAMVLSDSPEGFEGFKTDAIVGISILVLFVWSLLNIVRVDRVGWFVNLGAIVQIGSMITIILVLFTRASKLQTAEFVFTKYINLSGFSQKSYVVAVGLLASLFAFSGYEASAHMAEETHGARGAAPRGIIYTCLATGLTGITLILAFLFATDDVAAVLGSDDYGATDDYTNSTLSAATNVTESSFVYSGEAVFEIFRRAGGKEYGTGLAWLVVINAFFAGVSSVAVTGRITFALARDGGFPNSKFLTKVHPYFESPYRCIVLVWVLDSIMQLLPLVNEVAFTSITGITTIGFQVSYAIPIFLKVLFHNERFKDDVYFPETPSSLGGWSRPLGIFASTWLFGTSCLFFLPSEGPVTLDNMNWTIVIIGGVFFVGLVHWIVSGQYHFKGPRRVIDAIKLTRNVSSPDTEAARGVGPSHFDSVAHDKS